MSYAGGMWYLNEEIKEGKNHNWNQQGHGTMVLKW